MAKLAGYIAQCLIFSCTVLSTISVGTEEVVVIPASVKPSYVVAELDNEDWKVANSGLSDFFKVTDSQVVTTQHLDVLSGEHVFLLLENSKRHSVKLHLYIGDQAPKPIQYNHITGKFTKEDLLSVKDHASYVLLENKYRWNHRLKRQAGTDISSKLECSVTESTVGTIPDCTLGDSISEKSDVRYGAVRENFYVGVDPYNGNIFVKPNRHLNSQNEPKIHLTVKTVNLKNPNGKCWT